MKRSLLLAAGLTAAISIPAVAQAFWWGGDKKADAPVAFKLNGAGATFPAPLYNLLVPNYGTGDWKPS